MTLSPGVMRWWSLAWLFGAAVGVSLMVRSAGVSRAWLAALYLALLVQALRVSGIEVGAWLLRTRTRDVRLVNDPGLTGETGAQERWTVHVVGAVPGARTTRLVCWRLLGPPVIVMWGDADAAWDPAWCRHQEVHHASGHVRWAAAGQTCGLFVAAWLFLTVNATLGGSMHSYWRVAILALLVVAIPYWDDLIRWRLDRRVGCRAPFPPSEAGVTLMPHLDLALNMPVCRWALASPRHLDHLIGSHS